jgi:hypothetical protein
MNMASWLQAVLGNLSQQRRQRVDVRMVLVTNAVLIGFNIALTDMLLTKVMTVQLHQPAPTMAEVSCAGAAQLYEPPS